MLNTYIKSRGISETIIRNNNRNHFNKINWDSDYDGNVANLSINSNTDGKNEYFNVTLDNNDLADMLNVPSVNMPIDKRLKMDFVNFEKIPEQLLIELPTPKLEPRIPSSPKISSPIEELISRHISSPKSGEEFLVPITIDKKTVNKFTLTPRKKHKKHKTHVTHKIYKKNRKNSKSKSRSSSKKSSSRRL